MYPEYKDSGVKLLGRIPVDWVTMQLKRTVDGCVNGIWGAEPQKDGKDTVVLRVADFDRAKLSIQGDGYTYRKIEEKEKFARKLKFGDLLLEKSGGGEKTLVGQVVLFDKDFEAVTSNFVAKMTPKSDFDCRFLNYVFSRFYSENINYCSIKQNTGIQNLDSASYLVEKFAFPQEKEQQKIANFLDHETAKIDTLIEKQQQLIKLLKEKRQAVISHAVTKGLNPDAAMRDSGVEWLGEVPEHWVITRLKYKVEMLPGYAFKSTGFIDSPEETNLLRGINIAPGIVRWDEAVYWPSNNNEDLTEYELQEKDLVLGMDRPWVGGGLRLAMMSNEDLPAYVVQRIARIRGVYDVSQEYLFNLLSAPGFSSYFAPITTGVSVPHISTDQIGEYYFACPPKSERQDIVEFIGLSTSIYKKLIDSSESAIKLMQERRTALISAAVTGKIDVRHFAIKEGQAPEQKHIDNKQNISGAVA